MADSTVPQAKQRVRETLEGSFDEVEFDADGNASFRYGSARVFVHVREFDDDSAVVVLESPIVTGAQLSAELYEYVATEAAPHEFGHLKVVPNDDGSTATINFTHSLLGDYLDDMELRVAAVAVAFTADDLDDKLCTQFGGEKYHAD
jgi:hypothetical protein